MIKHGAMHDMGIAGNPEARHSCWNRLRRVDVTGIFRVFVLLPVLLASAGQAAAQAIPSLPVMMVLSGAVSPGTLTAADGDTVLVVNVATGATEATGTVGSGMYDMIIGNKAASLNGAQMVLYLKHLNTLYRLLNATGGDAVFTFNGSVLPSRTQINVVATNQVAGTAPGTGTSTSTSTGTVTTTAPAVMLGDLNGDGAVNEVDVGLLKQAISGQTAIDAAKMDINSDGVVNTRDLIDLIRMVREKSFAARKPASIIPVRQ